MTKVHFAIVTIGVLIMSSSFSLIQKKTIYLEKIEVTTLDSTFKLEKILIVTGEDSLIYKINKGQKPIKIDITKSLKLLIYSSNDTLEINDLKETFEENENFSLRIFIPEGFDYCYSLAYFGNYGEEYGFYRIMEKDSSMILDHSKKCIEVFVDSYYEK